MNLSISYNNLKNGIFKLLFFIIFLKIINKKKKPNRCDGTVSKIATSLGPHVVRRLAMKQAATTATSRNSSKSSSSSSSSTSTAITTSMTTRLKLTEKIDVDCGEDSDSESGSEGEPVGDVEDMGGGLDGEVDQRTTEQLLAIPNDQRREMVSDLQRRTLQKQGYQLIGSHSAVKMCRWTKAQLRGRGGCCMYFFTSFIFF